jgi:hypothetical protein
MFPDSTEPTEIMHSAYLNAITFLDDSPTEIVALRHYRKLNHYASIDG